MPLSIKVATLVEEGARRLRNTCPSLQSKERKAVLQQFNVWLFKAGYSETFRFRITEQAIRKYEKLKENRREREKESEKEKPSGEYIKVVAKEEGQIKEKNIISMSL